MTEKMDLTILIPVYNEAATLRQVIPEICQFGKAHGIALIWINDGSTDDSDEIIQELAEHGTVITHNINRGYGGALKSGILAAKTSHVISIDADGQHHLPDVIALFKVREEEDADMVTGKRPSCDDSCYRKLGKAALRFVAEWLIPLHVHDINTGMKLYRRDLAMQYIDLLPNSMAYSDTVLFTFIYQRHKVVEHPITIQKRMCGQSTITTRTAFQTLYEILSIVMLFNPIRIFLPLALFSFLLGALWSIRFIILKQGIPVASGVLIISAVVCFLIGLVAQQISGI